MTNEEIISALWERDEAGLQGAMERYTPMCRRITGNLLSPTDAEEVTADVWWKLWQSVPPNRPVSLGAYICRIARNLTVNRYRHNRAACRTPEVLADWEELTENPALFTAAVYDDPTAETTETAELAAAVDRFLRTLPKGERILFIRRYVFLDDSDTLAAEMQMTKGHIRVKLHRIRKRLMQYLKEEKWI